MRLQNYYNKKYFHIHRLQDLTHTAEQFFDKLSKCHTSKIGVHQYRCNNTNCNHVHYQYHSCGNRHCPTCGGMRREAWIEDRMSECCLHNISI
ncbi:MAG: transposase zinc-binding domain-containing protein [Saprospiraceae bacterium]|nr:transposase zinc-binding domain-containing protein [Saprospiraceae bacterium]